MTADRLLVACKRSLLSCPVETTNALATHSSACETCDGGIGEILSACRSCAHGGSAIGSLNRLVRTSVRTKPGKQRSMRVNSGHSAANVSAGHGHYRSLMVTGGSPPGSNWGSRGRRFKSSQPDWSRAGATCTGPCFSLETSAIDSCCIVLSSTYLLRRVGPRPAERLASVSKATVSAHGSGGRCD